MKRWSMRSRRGSMQLGIETVVILIIAIVLMGSLIYFIRTLITPEPFKITDDQCGQIIQPTEVIPIKIPSGKNIIKQGGDTTDIALCVKNTYGKNIENAKVQIVSCVLPDLSVIGDGAAGGAPFTKISSEYLTYAGTGISIKRNEIKAFNLKIQAKPKVTQDLLGTWQCQVQISPKAQPIDDTAGTTNNPGIGPVELTFEVE